MRCRSVALLLSTQKMEIELSPRLDIPKWIPSGCHLRPAAVLSDDIDEFEGSREDIRHTSRIEPRCQRNKDTSDDNSLVKTMKSPQSLNTSVRGPEPLGARQCAGSARFPTEASNG